MEEDFDKEHGHTHSCNCAHCSAEEERKQSNNAKLISCDCGCCDNKKVENESKNTFLNGYLPVVLQIVLSFGLIVASVFVRNEFLSLASCVIAAIICGAELIISSFKRLAKKQVFSENLLMLIAAVTAFIMGEGLEGALIITLFRLGELLEDVATDSSVKKIEAISKIEVNNVLLYSEKGLQDALPDEVPVGGLILVNKGERVPIDGVLSCGVGEFDTKAITGESKILSVESGDAIYSGSINLGESVIIRTTKLFGDSVAQRIVKIVEESLDKKARCERFISSFAKKYTPTVCVFALLIAIVPPLFDGMNFYKWIYKALAFLVVSCPCALVISVPLAFFIGIGALARIGILVKSTKSLETLSTVTSAVFDKTGTLTMGEFKISEIKAYSGFEKNTVIEYASALEKYSTHPIANVIASLENSSVTAENVKEISGAGVVGVVNGKTVGVGNGRLMRSLGIVPNDKNDGEPVIFVAVDETLCGEIRLTDTVKPNCKNALEKTRREGIKKIAILSGDKKSVAEEVGNALGVDLIYSELLPEEKVKKLNEFKNEKNGKVVYVGDGINDAPTLAAADVGIAMGGLGSYIAIESADIVVLDDDLTKLSRALKHSKKVMRTVKENIVFSLGVKFLIMALSVAVTIPMGLAMFADIGVMLLAVLNSFRCGKTK